MAYQNKKLQLEQIDEQLKKLRSLDVQKPQSGWVKYVRTAIGMSARQLANRLGISQQALAGLEKREIEESISLSKLREIGEKLDLKLVYSFVPIDSLESMVKMQARKVAQSIVMKTSTQMILEDQKISDEKILKSIGERALEIERKLPKYLWD
jgi:predicted DNA-binding mobile mystery protein A